MKKYYPKDMWRVRVNGENIIVKAKQEQLEELWKQNKIMEYSMLEVFKIK